MNYSDTMNSTETTKQKTPRWWIKQVECAEKEREGFTRMGREAYDEFLFRDASKSSYNWNKSSKQHLPIFYSSKKTLLPAIYSNLPVPVVKRRFDDTDDVSRVGSEVLERLAKYLLEEGDYHHAMKRSVQDYIITSYGCARIYVSEEKPTQEKVYIPDDEVIPPETKLYEDEQGRYVLVDQQVGPTQKIIPKWQPWDTVIHTAGARDWDDVWWRGYISFFDKEKFKEQFDPDGSKGLAAKLPFVYNQRSDDKDGENYTKSDETDKDEGEYAKVVEIWDERKKEIMWLCPDIDDEFLRQEADIYKLRQFFPAPRPIQEAPGDRSLYPTPEFIQTRCILGSIDFLMNRMWRLIDAMRAQGIYDSSQKEIKRLTQETSETDLIPVDNIMALIDKGGLDNIVMWLDKSHLAQALMHTYTAIDKQKEYYYEITGQSDLMRGVVAASESATATATKDKFISIRLSEHTSHVETFAKELIEIMLDMALEVFDDNTIMQVVSADQFSEEDQEMLPMAMQLIRDDKLRTFKVNIETDSTIAINSENEKLVRMELLESVSMALERLISIMGVMPEFAPVMMDTILYTMRGMKQATAIETSVEGAFQKIRERLENPPEEEEEQEDPVMQLEQLKMQVEMEKLNLEREKLGTEGQKMQVDMQRFQSDVAVEQIESAAEHEKAVAQLETARMNLQTEQLKAQLAQQQMQMKAMEAALKQQSQDVPMPTSAPVKADPVNLTINMPSGKKIGRFVDTPEGRQMIVETVDEGV